MLLDQDFVTREAVNRVLVVSIDENSELYGIVSQSFKSQPYDQIMSRLVAWQHGRHGEIYVNGLFHSVY